MSIFSSLKDHITRYVSVQVGLIKIAVIERTASILGYVVFALIAIPLSLCIFLLCGLSLSEWFIELTGSRPLGYLCGAGGLLLVLLFFFVLRGVVVKSVGGSIIRSLSNNNGDAKEGNIQKK